MRTYETTVLPLGVATNGGGSPPDYLGFPWNVENELERLKNRLLREALLADVPPAQLVTLRRAANEAASIAWLEPHPLLAFPELFREIAAAVGRSHKRQRPVAKGQSDIELVREAA